MNVLRFTPQKKKIALEELSKIMECGDKAGISHAMFMGFGVMLGQVMMYDQDKQCGDFIPDDDDMDVCIDADAITPEQEVAYFHALADAGLFQYRRRISFRKVESGFSPGVLSKRTRSRASSRSVRLTWLSLKHQLHGVKCCNWFMFRHGGYMWHTKSGKWVTRRKFNNRIVDYDVTDDAIMKGIPEYLLDAFVERDFNGIQIRFPEKIGTCADFWYPGWWLPKQGGASKKKVLCVVKNWLDKRTWKISVA